MSMDAREIPESIQWHEGLLLTPQHFQQLSLRHVVSGSPPKKYVALPLARVYCRDETYTLTDFIPPALAVERQSQLGVICSWTARRLREKAMYLADQLRLPATGARAGVDRETEGLIRSIVASLPLLEAVLGTGASHPFIVYLALCSVAGQVSVMGRSLVPPAFAPYDHNDLRATFEPVLAYISRKVDEGVTATFTAHPFRYEEGVYSLMFERAWAGKRLAVGIRGATGTGEQEVVRWGYACVIGSRSRMRAMRESRVLGARRELVERDEDLVPPRGVVLFSLRADPEFSAPD